MSITQEWLPSSTYKISELIQNNIYTPLSLQELLFLSFLFLFFQIIVHFWSINQGEIRIKSKYDPVLLVLTTICTVRQHLPNFISSRKRYVNFLGLNDKFNTVWWFQQRLNKLNPSSLCLGTKYNELYCCQYFFVKG